MTASVPPPRACWCGHAGLQAYSDDYHVCQACGTLVSRATAASGSAGLYTEEYWSKRQTEHHGLPDIHARARLDLPERCTHWLRHLLSVRLPPARILEIGCGHGAYVALLGWAGFEAVGTELSPRAAEIGRKAFGAEVHAGPVESLPPPAAGFDAIVLNDVLEHLPEPAAILRHCAGLLKPDGFFVIQTPEYKEHLAYADLRASGDLFLKHMDRNNDEHLYLFSRRSAGIFFTRLGFPIPAFANPVYAYDMFFTASHAPLPVLPDDIVAQNLLQRPAGRLVLALLDKAFESNDRWWAMQRLEAGMNARQTGPGQGQLPA